MHELFEQLSRRCQQAPDDDAIVCVRGADRATTTSTQQFVAMVLACHDALSAEGGAGRQVVPIFANRSAECLAAMLGTVLSGHAFACLNTRLRPMQVEELLNASGARSLLCDADGQRLLGRSSDGRFSGRTRIIDEFASSPSALGGPFAAGGRLASLAKGLDADHAACCLFTSGSTGTPKGVLISASDLLTRARNEVVAYRLCDEDRVLNVLPFAFDVGLNQALTALLVGAVLVILGSWLPVDVLRAIETYRITGVSGVPAVWRDLRRSGLAVDTGGRHRSLRYVTVSGGSLTLPELEHLPQLLPGVGIYKTYGQTESFRSTMLYPHEFDTRMASVGRPFEGAMVHIVDEEGNQCPTGEIGEIVHSGLGVMMGYLGGADPSNKRRPSPFQNADGSEFAIWTGDWGYVDSGGYLYLKGRRDGMIKVAGNRFYADEVANVIAALPGVSDVEVLGLEEAQVETRLMAFLVSDGEHSEQSVRRALERSLPSYMVPSLIRLVPALPRLPNGKTDRVRLRAMACEQNA